MITPSFGLTATERVLPKLTLDFTTASLDNRITFTRAGNTATVINSSGLVTTINADLPRFDYTLNTGGDCKGLLIEEARTNLFLQSNDVSNAAYTVSNVTVVANSSTAPDGTLTAAKATITNTAANQFFQYNLSSFAGQTLTVSFHGKADSPMTLQSHISDSVAGEFFFPSLTTTWQRFTYTMTQAVTSPNTGFFISLNTNSTTPFYIWGVQLEVGAFATSLIPTTAATVTRNADVAVMTGTNFSDWYSAGAGGIVARVLPSTVSGTRPALQLDDATANEVIALRGSTTNPELVIVDGGSPQAQIDAGTIVANTAYNLGTAWNTDNCAAAVNGGAAVTDTTATIPTVTQARLGSDGTNYLNGNIQTLRYWPQRIIDAEVQAFSK
jgi:hypothetical protein